MINRKKNVLIYYVPLLALLLSLCIPTLSANATKRSSDKIKPGDILVEGDTIVCKDAATISVTYQLSGETVTATGNEGTLDIIQQSDSTGKIYKRYRVTSVSLSENELQFSLSGIPVPSASLEKLIISTPPSKITYMEGESFDKKGMVVTACYSDGTWTNIEDYKVSPSGAIAANVTSVTISYTDDGNVTQSATQKITVEPKTPDSYIISASAAAGGSISDSGNSSVKRGDSKTYTITPYNGYRVNYVEVDGNSVGAVSSYTFNDVQGNHSINAYFLTGSAEIQNSVAKRNLTVIGSFAAASGAGSYLPETKVTVDAGFIPGFTFAGWAASDGTVYPLSAMSYVMPAYDVLLYANWIQSGTPNAISPITTTNLNGQQLTGWADITNKLASLSINDLSQPNSPVLKVTVDGFSCYIDAAPIATLNTRQGFALDVSYGDDASFTFYSDTDNSQFTGTDLSYTCSTSSNFFFHEKSLDFTQTGPINTSICLNVSLPDAQAGQMAYVYLVSETGTEMIYLPAIVDAENKITIPISAKVNISIKY